MKKHPDLRNSKCERRARRAYALFTCLVAALSLTVMPAMAADDPLAVVNNLSDFIFSLIRAIGLILPRSLPAGQWYAHHCRRHCDHLYQGDPHPHHRLRPLYIKNAVGDSRPQHFLFY